MTSTSLPHANVFTPNHYNGRNGYTVDHITLHIMVGTLSGTDTVFMNPNYRASSHYGIGGNGDIHQYVDEDNGSWADGDMASDCSGITIEHEGGSPSIRCTDACVEASAQLCADISRRYNLGFLKHDGLNGNVYLHREVPGTDHAGCPDLAPNGLPVDKVLARANEILTGQEIQPIKEEEMPLNAFVRLGDEPGICYFDGCGLRAVDHPDEMEAVNIIARETEGKNLPLVSVGTAEAPYHARLLALLQREYR